MISERSSRGFAGTLRRMPRGSETGECIHDCMNLDWQRIEAVMAARQYREVARYIAALSDELLTYG